MKRDRVLVAFLALFLILIVNPLTCSIPAARGNEHQETSFLTAADGDESSESLTTFSETLADDVLYYSDAFWNGTIGLADWGTAGPDSSENDYTYTHSGSNNEYKGFETTSGTSYIIINFTLPAQSTFEAFDYDVYAAGANDDDEANLWAYDWTARDWDLIVNMATLGQAAWYNGTGVVGPYSEDSQFSIMVNSTDADNPSECEIAIAHLTFYVMTLADSDHYAEGFNGASDFTTSDCSISTDGDVATITEDGTGSTGRAYASFSSTDYHNYYYETRVAVDTSANYALEFYSGSTWHTLVNFSAAGTYRGIISDSNAATMTRIGFWVSGEGKYLKPDYLRIQRSNESGWAHDGSTTAGVANDIPLDYEEDFTDISDWYNNTWGAGGVITNPAGIGTIHSPGDSTSRYVHTYGPSFPDDAMQGLTMRIRCRVNTTSGAYFRVWWTGSGLSPNVWSVTTIELSTSWAITDFVVPDYVVDVEGYYLQYKGMEGPVKYEVDYIEVGCTAQFDDSGTYTSDGDELTLTADADGSVFAIQVDTTATQTMLDTDYYPMLALDFNDADSADYIKVESYDGSGYATVIANTTIGTDTLRVHTHAVDDDIEAFWISVNPSAVVRLKWIKACSIANFTYTSSGVGVDDYLYVDSGVLYSHIDDGYIELNHDPALSVAQASYPVYNLTTSGTAPQFSQYVSEWSTYSDDTRGATTSGTLTDLKLKFDSTETLSAIKFIEDGTAPTVVRSSSTPNDPEDDETVTLSAVITDALEVWSVAFNAIVYPTGFSDVDYDATEQADNLWTYEFSSLITGYYCFKIIASDGANTNALTEYAYIEITVREAVITISTYTFFGASSDFSYMQYSGHISHDCTYNISEWSTTWAKNETHTGSVTEGMFNIAWDKITVDDAEANFTIVFVSGSLSLTIEGYYGTAYKELRITEIDVMNMEESLAVTNITVNFYTNKDVDWYVYDVDNSDAVLASGSSLEGSDDLYFLKNRIPYAHFYAVKWDDGVTQIWFNSSYWTYRQNIDAIDPAWADWGAKDARKTIEFWVTISAFIGIGGFIVLGIMHYDTREKLKKLQLPSYRTQEREKK